MYVIAVHYCLINTFFQTIHTESKPDESGNNSLNIPANNEQQLDEASPSNTSSVLQSNEEKLSEAFSSNKVYNFVVKFHNLSQS